MTLKQIWWAYHKQNPKVYELFERFTFEVIDAGFKHYSAMAIIQQIRWHTDVVTRGDNFKINNNHVPYYSRLFAHNHPQHADFFRFRSAGE